LFFVTVCTARRGVNTLCLPKIAARLIEAAAVYHEREIWYARLFLLMPDHWHALLAFPPSRALRTTVMQWKSFTAKSLRSDGLAWQHDYFDHRLRHEESVDAKADYIRDNPVRKGLVTREEDWPWVFTAGATGQGGPGATSRSLRSIRFRWSRDLRARLGAPAASRRAYFAATGFGFVIGSKLSVRNGVTGRPSAEKRLQTGLSAQA
jgi:putative transposase